MLYCLFIQNTFMAHRDTHTSAVVSTQPPHYALYGRARTRGTQTRRASPGCGTVMHDDQETPVLANICQHSWCRSRYRSIYLYIRTDILAKDTQETFAWLNLCFHDGRPWLYAHTAFMFLQDGWWSQYVAPPTTAIVFHS